MRVPLTTPVLNLKVTTDGGAGVGRGCFVGAGAAVIQQASVREKAVMGVGALVIGDIPANVIAAGVPARIVMHHGS